MERNRHLDAARALAVVAMVFGHSLDAVLSTQVRSTLGGLLYWEARTVTAPLFLMVSGWAVVMTVTRLGLSGRALLRRYLPRVGLLFALGWFLRFPAWDVAGLFRGEEALVSQLLAFDALHCIAASLLCALVVLSVFKGQVTRKAVFAGLVVALPLLALPLWRLLEEGPLYLRLMLGSPRVPFPLVPWASYFFAGALGALWLGGLERAPRRVIALLLGGLIAVVLAGPAPTQAMALGSWNRWVWRLGPVLIVLAGVFSLPQAVAKALGPVGRVSLWVYVIHLPLAYGWGFFPGLATRIGPTLAPGPALAVALGVCTVSIAAALLGKRRLWPLLRAAPFGRRQPASKELAGQG